MKRSRLTHALLGVLFPFALLAQNVVTITSNIEQNTTWTAENTYLLVGYVYVRSGATLTIQPGTVIKGDKDTRGTLIVTRGSQIMANGTRSQPIVFTSNQPDPAPGDWGGVVICGYAATNTAANGIGCLGVVEGGINTTSGDALYGAGDQPLGCNAYADDNSGVLRFVRIEYSGVVQSLNREINGLMLAGVGRGTTIEYVQVSHSLDDGFEFFGGTVSAKHLIAYGNRDDDFDFDLGYQGNIQYGLAIRNPELADLSGSNGIEVDNDETGTPASPKTRPTLSNMTIIGPSGSSVNDNYRRAANFRRNAEPGLFNSILIGQFPIGIGIDGVGTVANAQTNRLQVESTRLADAPELLKTSEPNFNINQWFNTTAWNNSTATNSGNFGLMAPFNFANPDPQPTSGAAVNSAAQYESARLQVPFFHPSPYIGALSPTEDWTCGWAKFAALNTNCTSATHDADQWVSPLQLRPNLTADRSTLTFDLRQSTDVSIEVYDLGGRLQQQVQPTHRLTAGTQTFELSASELPEGMYFVRVQAGAAVQVEKLLVVR
jgi:hypothetical protein